MTARLVDKREISARPWLPAEAPAWSFWIGPTGEVLRVNADGSATPILPPGHPRPGIAAEPTATGGARHG